MFALSISTNSIRFLGRSVADNSPFDAHDCRSHHGTARRFNSTKTTENVVDERPPGVRVRRRELCQELQDMVVDAEHVRSRRVQLKRLHLSCTTRRPHSAEAWDRTNSMQTGLAIAGGGFRSASFGLGALQGLIIGLSTGVDGLDNLLTVSGYRHRGCALTAASQNCVKTFPFLNHVSYGNTASVGHIKGYVISRVDLDVVTRVGIIERGFVANVLLLAPMIFFCLWITLSAHPNNILRTSRTASAITAPGCTLAARRHHYSRLTEVNVEYMTRPEAMRQNGDTSGASHLAVPSNWR